MKDINKWNEFCKMLDKYEFCIKYKKSTLKCDKHDIQKCKSIKYHHKELQTKFDQIKDDYNFDKLNLGQGRHTKTPWISFKKWKHSAIYPCIIFSKNKIPYLTLQIEQRDPLSPKENAKLPIKVIILLKEWFQNNKDYNIEKILDIKHEMSENRYNKSSICSIELKSENQISNFYESSCKILDIDNIIFKVIFTEIIDNDQKYEVIFFKTTKDSEKFPLFVREIFKTWKEVVIFPFVEISYPKRQFRQLPIYKIDKVPEKEVETNDYVFSAKLFSLNSSKVLETISLFSKHQNIKIINEAKTYSEQDIKNKIKEYLVNEKINERTKKVTRSYDLYRRNRKIRLFAIAMSKGYCQLCDKIAPFFIKNNTEPYLESDHIKEMKDGGRDTIENVIALCPNCHRKKTYWDDKEGLKKIIKRLKMKNKILLDKWQK